MGKPNGINPIDTPKKMSCKREAKKGSGDNVPSGVWGRPHRNLHQKKRSFRADCEAVYD